MTNINGVLLDFDILNNRYYKDIIKKKNNDLYKKYKGKIGVICLINNRTFGILNKLSSASGDRYFYINSREFIDNISDRYYFVYDIDKNALKLLNHPKMKWKFEIIFNIIRRDLNLSKSNLLVFVESDYEDIEILLDLYFQNPYNCRKTIFEKNVKYSLTLSRLLNVKRKYNISLRNQIIKDINTVMDNKNKVCNVSVMFSDKCIDRFNSFIYDKKGKATQFEVAGKLNLTKVNQHGDKLVVTVDVDEDKLVTGENETVEGVLGKYTFHSHPIDCYINNKVFIGWPSGQDYAGYHAFEGKCYIHMVITVEGIYIIMYDYRSSSDVLKLNISKNYLDKLSISHKKGLSKWEVNKGFKFPNSIIHAVGGDIRSFNEKDKINNIAQLYCSKINNITDKHNNPIFFVRFKSWERVKVDPIFNVKFALHVGSCCPL